MSASDVSDRPAVFVLATANGETLTGPLQALGEHWSVELGGDSPSRTAGDAVVSLRQKGKALPDRPTGEQVVFANGDQVPGAVQKLSGESLFFRAAAGAKAEWKLPLSALALVWAGMPEGTRHADHLRRRLMSNKRPRDTLLLRNGDVAEGILTTLDRQKIEVEMEKRRTTLNFDKLAVIALNTDLVRFPRPKAPYAHLVLADGGRLALVSARADDGTLKGTTLFGADVEVPVADVIALDLYQGRAVYLSDLKPVRYEFTPFLNDRWPYVPDGSVAGRDLRLGGSTYDKGVGVHSQSRLVYDLSAGYRRFETLIGLDDQTGNEGSVAIQVLVDGKPRALGWDNNLSGRDSPRPIRVNVAGARELTLVVEFGRGGHVQDHVGWADARLIK